jgi:hypothetical protein
MNRIIPFLVLLLLGSDANGQILKGTIFDKETKSPIPIAVVYFDGTSVATYTDEEGKFLLDSKSHSNLPLTVSALGYYSTVINEFSSTKDIIVYLEPKLFEFDDVTIKARGNSNIRKQNVAIFRREFLGRTSNAKECEILNEDDIRFITSKDKDTVRAYSLKPIFVTNKALGYKITYFLNKFEYVKSAYRNQLIGNSIFDEDTLSTDTEIIRLRRDNTYYGSKMHFIRSLWRTDLKSPGYTIKNLKKQVPPSEMVRNRLSSTPGRPEKLIYYPSVLPVLLSVKWVPGKADSGMELLRNNISIEENGFYKGPGILWHGEMAKQGIADLLPYDYKPSEEFDPKIYTNFQVTDTISSDQISGQAELTEKAYLHTDRDIYNQGDDIWFKAYIVDGIFHELSDSSGNLHVELISPGLKIIDHRIIKLKNGLGNGDFNLSDTLKSGYYMLRAYTRYMKNFGDQAFFYKGILITNGSDYLTAADTLIKKQYKPEFQFFPESGSLIEYVPSVLAFKAMDQNGLGRDVSGEIHTSAGEIITTFRSTHLGMGKFNFTPAEGVDYYASIKYPDGNVIKKALPSALQVGFVINSITNNLNQALITLKTNSNTYATYKNRDILISISSHGKILKVITARITSLNSSFVLPIEELPNGILMITMFAHDNKPLCERLVYIENGPDLVLSLETNQSSYQKRDSTVIRLSVNDFLGNDSDAFLSLSVNNNIYSHPFPSTISSWFFLESDIHGPIENPSYYFDPSEPERLKNLDLLLLTHGWRDFEWKYKAEKLLYEKGFNISGKLRKTLLDIPITNQQVTLAIIQNNKNIITSTQTDSTGRFLFEIENMAGHAKILLSAVNKKGDFTGRFILDSINPKPHIVKKELFDLLVHRGSLGISNIQQVKAAFEFEQSVNKKYTLSDTIMIGEVQITAIKKESVQENRITQSREKYGHPDKEIIVNENLRNASNIRELLTGRVAGIMFTRTSSTNDSGIRIRGVSSLLLSQEPLFLLDGLAVSYSLISALPISFIDRVDVIKAERAAAYGSNGANGIISVITKAGPDLNSTSETHSLSMIVNGFNEPRIFYSKTHNLSRVTEYKPDLRATLLWLPNLSITTNKDYLLKYYNGDIPSKYRINVEGITPDGRPISGHFDYELLNKR